MNKAIYTQSESLNMVLDDVDKTLRVESSSDNPLFVTMTDTSGRQSINTVFGLSLVAEEKSEFNANFSMQADTRKLKATVTNGGTIGRANSSLIVSSGTNANGSAIASSGRALAYKAGQEGYIKFTPRFTIGVVGNKRYVGLIDETDGFAVGLDGLDFVVVRKRNGVIVETVKQQDFNKDKLDGTGRSELNLDYTKGNVFRISYGYLGYAPIRFEILTENYGYVTFHVINYLNAHEDTHIRYPYIKVQAQNFNSGSTVDSKIYLGSIDVGTTGGSQSREVSARKSNFNLSIPSITANTENVVLVFHNKPTYGLDSLGQPEVNKIESLLSYLTISTEGNKPVKFKRYVLATAPTGGTWTNISVNSIMRYSTNATVSLVGAELSMPLSLAKSDTFFEILEELDFRSLPNEYIAYTFQSSQTSEIELGVGWKELF